MWLLNTPEVVLGNAHCYNTLGERSGCAWIVVERRNLSWTPLKCSSLRGSAKINFLRNVQYKVEHYVAIMRKTASPANPPLLVAGEGQ